MRIRKNINCLTTNELHDLREALARMYMLPASDPNSFAVQAGFHGGPPTAYCRHGPPGFLSWHRAYMMAFENALHSVDCGVSLPYWDWSSGPTTGVPPACRDPTYVHRNGSTVPNPLYAGPRASGGMTGRRPDIDSTSFADLATGAQNALAAMSFSSFQGQMDGVHGGVHVRVGGDMSSIANAAYDPIFYLHHANVDRLWARWQTNHPGATPASELTFQLPPFNRPFTTQWQTGADVDSTATLGYAYRTYCILYIPPVLLRERILFEIPLAIRKNLESARLVVRSDRMQAKSMEVRASVSAHGDGVQTRPVEAAVMGLLGTGEAVTAFSVREAPGQAEGRPVVVATNGGGTNEHRQGHAHDHGHDHAHGHDHGHDDAPREHAGREQGGTVLVQRQAQTTHAHGGGSTTAGERFDKEMDITAALRALDGDVETVAITLDARDAHGCEVEEREFRHQGVELLID